MQTNPNDPMLDRGKNLMVSISGIRGVIPEGLDPVNIVQFSLAFASISGKKIVIGNDARPTGPILRHLLTGTLLACGKEIIDIGLAPTPTVKAAVALNQADAGVMISASHNPPEWNAFKFIGPGGFFFDHAQSAELIKAVQERRNPSVGYQQMGHIAEKDGVWDHIRSVLSVIPNLDEIRKKQYKVVVDAVSGAGREALPKLLQELGCSVIPIFCEPTSDGSFPRPPEPTPSALQKFGDAVKKEKAAAGFALDPDADRLVAGSPLRGTINEEYTLPLALMGLEKKIKSLNHPLIVLNQSTADLTESVAVKFGAKVIRSAVGEANVVEMMREKNAVYGGEGNGGVILPDVPSFGRDTLTGAAFILSAMAGRDAENLDELMDELPDLYMKKAKMEIDSISVEDVYANIKHLFSDSDEDTTDGLRITLKDGSWIHARPSNTEPIMRIIAQSPTESKLKEILSKLSVSE
ncbi:MAG: phosphoglucosamine mutase [Spirochaetia bacterium]|nr:phosphoglucosamine mutase [Spirochaetia bacterium]